MILTSLKEKIGLGTVQLGLNYGINNTTGKPDKIEAFNILSTAEEQSIHTLDTADAYGNSIEVIGDFLKSRKDARFNIVSKFIDDGVPIQTKLNDSLAVLGRNQLYGYMYHRFNDYSVGTSKEALADLKRAGLIAKIGVSVYGIEDLSVVVDDDTIDLIQVPYNLLDGSTEKRTLLRKAKSLGKEIHVRSIFLQGLLFKKPEALTGNLKGLYPSFQQFHGILKTYDLNVMEACLNHAVHNPLIDVVVIGVEKKGQLIENLKSLRADFPSEIMDKLDSIQVSDKTLLNPTRWEP